MHQPLSSLFLRHSELSPRHSSIEHPESRAHADGGWHEAGFCRGLLPFLKGWRATPSLQCTEVICAGWARPPEECVESRQTQPGPAVHKPLSLLQIALCCHRGGIFKFLDLWMQYLQWSQRQAISGNKDGASKLGMVAQAYKAEAEGSKFKSYLGNFTRPCLRTRTLKRLGSELSVEDLGERKMGLPGGHSPLASADVK